MNTVVIASGLIGAAIFADLARNIPKLDKDEVLRERSPVRIREDKASKFTDKPAGYTTRIF